MWPMAYQPPPSRMAAPPTQSTGIKIAGIWSLLSVCRVKKFRLVAMVPVSQCSVTSVVPMRSIGPTKFFQVGSFAFGICPKEE